MTSNDFKKNRLAFTLVELLIVVGLIAFMSSMITYALLGAQTDARVAKSRSTIQKLNEIVLQQWEEYRYRPVDIRKTSYRTAAQPVVLPSGVTPVAIAPRALGHLRMLVLRDTMRMEMPDRVTDILYGPSPYQIPQHIAQSGCYLANRAVPSKFGLLHSSLKSAVANSIHSSNLLGPSPAYPKFPDLGTSGVDIGLPSSGPTQLFTGNLADWETAVQSSELLYLIVSLSSFGGTPALEAFRPSEIGDPDQDGLLEFIDAWGRPIRWLRWPAGFQSDLNRYAMADAMDPLHTDWRYASSTFVESEKPQTIIPLIISSGADERFGIRFDFSDLSPNPLVYASVRQGSGLNQFYVDPYFVFVNNGPNDSNNESNLRPNAGRTNQVGSLVSADDVTDDITNHDLILEP